ncbi:MAG: class I SAM-dependent methyltransferase [Proteobacteria bacterium]|nr:class I SAM-dependent methyltransferase [Pseudomonadota bacterium]
MPDKIFSNPRLAAIYDHFDGPRTDLLHYLSIAKELGSKSIVDIGCGTGSFACKLAEEGYSVTAVDPADASLNIARSKLSAENVNWILGDATSLGTSMADTAFMTGNVAQVFVSDDAWHRSLTSIHNALCMGGHFVFEVRDPSREDWKNWTKENTFTRLEIPNIGPVEGWCELLDVSSDLVKFRWTYLFASDGAIVTSLSTLRFRDYDAIVSSLKRSGFVVDSVRDAADRPGKEFVFVCSKL